MAVCVAGKRGGGLAFLPVPPITKGRGRMSITLDDLIYTAIQEPELDGFDARYWAIWHKLLANPAVVDDVVELGSLAGARLCAYMKAAFLAGYRAGSDPAAFLRDVVGGAQ